MLEDELKQEEFAIDEKEAKKQFLEELKNKNMKENEEDENKNKDENDSTENESNIESTENEVTEVIDTENQRDLEVKNDEELKEEENSEELNLLYGNDYMQEKKKLLIGLLKVSLIDTAVTAIASFVGVHLFNLILRFIFGYYVVDFEGVYIILFLIMLVLYPCIMQMSKLGKTIGQKYNKI